MFSRGVKPKYVSVEGPDRAMRSGMRDRAEGRPITKSDVQLLDARGLDACA